jgi:hypothetical protein
VFGFGRRDEAGEKNPRTVFRQGKETQARKLATEAAVKMKPLPKDEKNPLG